MFEEVEAKSIARQGLAHGWPGEDCRDEIVERLNLPPSEADRIVLGEIRSEQEREIQSTHDEIAYAEISRYYQ